MRPYSLLMFLVLIGFVFSFSVSDYFYNGEDTNSVIYKNFTRASDDYSIVYINNSETFLLKKGEILRNKEEIEEVLEWYYKKEFYPSDSDISQIKELIATYDKSRNDGYETYKKQEEYACRQALFTDKKIEIYINNTPQKLWCHDDESCKINAMLLYSYGHEQFHWSSYEILIQPLKDFSYSSYGTDEIIMNYNKRLENLTKDNVVDTLAYMKSTIPVLKDYADKIESSIFRYPKINDSADKLACKNKCYAICPPLDLDQEGSLMKLKDRVDALYTKVQPLANLNSTVQKILKNTEERVTFYENKKTAEKYNQIFEPLEKKGKLIENEATQAYLLIANTNLNIKKEEAIALRESIRSKIDSANFTGLDDEIAQYEKVLTSLENKTAEIYSLYNEIGEAKKQSIANIFKIGSHDLSGDDQKKYEDYKNELQKLDKEMAPGISTDKANELKEKYRLLANATAQMVENIEASPLTTTTTPMRNFAIKANSWLAYATTTTNVATPSALVENKSTFLTGFVLLLFFSILAMVFLVFLTLLKLNSSKKMAYVFLGLFLISVAGLASAAGALFFLMDETSADATFNEFYDEFNNQKTVAVVIDNQLASATETKAMSTCAEKLIQTLKERNKTIDLIDKNDTSSCLKNNKTIDCAELNLYGAVIEFAPSANYGDSTFSTAFSVNAKIKEPVAYYEVCPIAEMLK
ncbi:MAG: hypothetical protein QW153_02330 [Candidatus Bilamarchaeaceae archaeon]